MLFLWVLHTVVYWRTDQVLFLLSVCVQAVSSEGTDQGGNGDTSTYCIPWVEACGLVTLCSYRTMTRRFSLMLLKEVRSLHEALAGESSRVSTYHRL